MVSSSNSTLLRSDSQDISRPITLSFTTALAVAEPAKIVPLYFFLVLLNSPRVTYTSVTGRPVPLIVAKALIITTFAAFAVCFTLYSMTAVQLAVHSTITWRSLPIFISIGIQLLTIKPIAERISPDQSLPGKAYMDIYLNKDYIPLTIWYRLALAFSIAGRIFVPISLTPHYYLLTIGVVVHCLQNVFQLRSLGYTTTKRAILAMIVGIIMTVVAGPAVTYTALWYWREHVVFRLSK